MRGVAEIGFRQTRRRHPARASLPARPAARPVSDPGAGRRDPGRGHRHDLGRARRRRPARRSPSTLGARAAAHVTASAAEKIYRSTGADDGITPVAVGRRAAPVSNSCRPRRSCSTARGCAAKRRRACRRRRISRRRHRGLWPARARRALHPRLSARGWEVRRDGTLVWGDALHIEGDMRGSSTILPVLTAPPHLRR